MTQSRDMKQCRASGLGSLACKHARTFFRSLSMAEHAGPHMRESNRRHLGLPAGHLLG